ncbi:IS1182 family transposase [Acetivibrio straminisolvens]|jgi:transposase|uniref:IS1182 family transposase n=1 Tax=Acetivibrio straminisolvens TaxID=253314 RepID=UPI00223EE765|nr:IS1182 family transposase [Acetivibrio straminisolvens]HOV25688.1 IS1182 family transposase [Pseudobacteroides sp.]
MKYIQGQDRHQLTLLPDCIEDYIGEENPVRVIDAFVDSLDLTGAGFIRTTPNETGRPPYSPKDLLKLYVYGYFNRIRSSRKLMIECTRNIELFYLLRKLTPDFRTIADFRKDNAKALKNVFRAFVKLCMNLDLYKKELLAIDGSKFRAVNSKDNAYNAEILEKKLKRIDEHIAEYLSQMDNEDKSEPDTLSPDKIKAAIEELTLRKEKYQGFLKELLESGETQLLLTDPEARRMHSKDGFHCCYNVQTAVDKGSHLIADYEVTNHNTDQGLLKEVAQSARENLEVETIEVVADKGYESREDILNCVMNGIVPNVALKYDKHERLYTIDYEEADITEEIKNSTKPEDIQKCIRAGVVPACYENTAISLELQEKSALSCFTLNDDGTVTCPMGNILSKVKTKGSNTWYRNKDACRQCPNKCTSSKGYKTVSFGPNTKYVPVRMYGSPSCKLNPIPDNIPMNPFNHTLDRKDYSPPKKIVLKIKEDIQKIKERMCLSEHPFGTVKWYNGANYLLCKGKEKATAELGLSFLAYNMKRAINMVGVRKLIEAI